MTDSIIQTKNCQHCQSSFDITQGDMDFYTKISPRFSGITNIPLEKGELKGDQWIATIPTPRLCPDCRQRRRLSFRNERKLYKRKCDASGKNIISIYHPDSEFKVFDQKIWWSDDRDPMDYGFEFNFSHDFTKNFRRLLKQVPQPALLNLNAENSEYCNRCNGNKGCYLCFMTSHSEDSMHGTFIQQSKNCVDCTIALQSNHCYGCCNIQSCYNLLYSNNCKDCKDSFYLDNCYGCANCYSCNNLKNQSYCIFNHQHTKEEYFEEIQKVDKHNIEIFKKTLIPEETNIGSEGSTGEYLTNCKNCISCTNGFDTQSAKFCLNFGFMQDCYDCTAFGYKCALGIENIAGEEDYHTGFTFATLNAQDVRYTIYCSKGIKNCFGCVGLRNKQYCIFNRQYENKEKYEEQVAKIIQHMMTTGERGEFFHPSLSPFGYNETVAQEYYPLYSDRHPEYHEGSILVSSFHSEGQQDINLQISDIHDPPMKRPHHK